MNQNNINQTTPRNKQTNEQRLAAGRELFDQLAANDSGIRGFSEALRTNTSDTYNREATANAFESGLPEDVERLGEIAARFSRVEDTE